MIITFCILSVFIIIGAVSTIRLHNIVYAVFSLMLLFSAIAGIFLLLMAEFVAVAQILIYLGAVGVLILFAVMLTHSVTGSSGKNIYSNGWGWGLLLSLSILFATLLPAIYFSDFPSDPAVEIIEPSVKKLGMEMMHSCVPAMWLIAILLTAALIGGIVIAAPPQKR